MGRKTIAVSAQDLMRLVDEGSTLKQAAAALGISYWTALNRLRQSNVRINQQHSHNTAAFETYTAESCYWAGFLAADGSVSKYRLSLELAEVDRDHVLKLKNFLDSSADVRRRRKKVFGEWHWYATMYVCSKHMASSLVERFNVVPAKSLILEPPELPENMMRHFIRGLVDGDGSIGWHKHNKAVRIQFGCGSERAVEWVKAGIKTGVPEAGNPSVLRRNGSDLFSVEFSGARQAVAIGKWLYSKASPEICLMRKKQLFDKLADRQQERKRPRLEEDKKLRDLYVQGMSYADIASHLNWTKSKVSYRMRLMSLPKRTSRNSGLTGAKIRKRDQEMLKAYQAGERPKDIAQRHGISLPTFWAAMRRVR